MGSIVKIKQKKQGKWYIRNQIDLRHMHHISWNWLGRTTWRYSSNWTTLVTFHTLSFSEQVNQ